MSLAQNITRVRKLAVSLTHPICWRGLMLGVAPTVEHLGIIRSLNVDGIIDVGANRGQFTLACRLAKPGVPIVAFEPIPAEASTFRKVHGQSTDVTLIETALGDKTDRATLHLSKSADCSSLLQVGQRQIDYFRDAVDIGTIEVTVQRLDDLSSHWNARNSQLMKLDVQGYELNVLRGATETLKSCKYVYAECSLVELYKGQALKQEVTDFLKTNGFIEKTYCNPLYHESQVIQADYLFERSSV